MAQSGRPVLPLDGDRAQVEEHERVVGPLGRLSLEALAVALKLPFPQRRLGVAGVPDPDFGPPHRGVHPAKGGQDLLVDRIRPRRSSRTEFPSSFRLPSMTEDHRPERGIDHGVPECAGATILNRLSSTPPPPVISLMSRFSSSVNEASHERRPGLPCPG